MTAKEELTKELMLLLGEGFEERELLKLLSAYTIGKDEENSGRSNLKKRIEYFLGAKKIDGLADRTIENYREGLNQFAAYVSKNVTKITTDDVREYVGYLAKDRHLKNSSIQTHITC